MSDDASRWRGAGPELTIAAVAVAAAMLAGGALPGWAGVATGAIAAAAPSMALLRGLLPRSPPQSAPRGRRKRGTRVIPGDAQRRFVVAMGTDSRAFYESDLRPVLEHLLAARLAEKHGVNLYTDPAAARTVFCRTRGDQALWRWVDPAQALPAGDREREKHGIPRRTLARL